jgi:regulation of enolase protein 1 (concanavalin A-like superfamily)
MTQRLTPGACARLLVALPVTFAVLASAAAAQTLPSGWTLRTIGGSGVLAGRASQTSGTYVIEGAGADIWGTADQFSYVYRQVTGDVTIVARVASVENTDPWAKAGVMIRETLSGGSKHAFALVSPQRGRALQYRSGTGGTTSSASGATGTAPVWLRVVRRGSTFTAARSADGVSWSSIGSATISMASSVYVGLAVTSHVPATLATGRFSNVQVTTPAAGLPSGWSTQDVGNPALGGSAGYASSVWTVRGGGSDIAGTADQFRFAYRPVSGDVDIVARVFTLRYPDEWSKAGVMIRSSLRSDSAHASMFVTGSNGLVFKRRPATGLNSLRTPAGSGGAPVWVKLERRGSAITAFRSSDGATWRMVGSETLSLPSTFYVGVAVTSRDRTALATGTFTNVSVRSASGSGGGTGGGGSGGGGTGNTPPTVSLTAPAAGAVFAAPASVVVSATASDTGGSVARVEFYRGSTLIATDTSSPYTITWSNVAAGSYSITAVAVDNAGASTRSAARSITVAYPNALTKAVFVPSPDHNTAMVASYRLEIFTAGANPATATAMAVRSLGKPPVVNGECRVDIATTIGSLPSGAYFAAVRAVGPNGMSPRALSASFLR